MKIFCCQLIATLCSLIHPRLFVCPWDLLLIFVLAPVELLDSLLVCTKDDPLVLLLLLRVDIWVVHQRQGSDLFAKDLTLFCELPLLYLFQEQLF